MKLMKNPYLFYLETLISIVKFVVCTFNFCYYFFYLIFYFVWILCFQFGHFDTTTAQNSWSRSFSRNVACGISLLYPGQWFVEFGDLVSIWASGQSTKEKKQKVTAGADQSVIIIFLVFDMALSSNHTMRWNKGKRTCATDTIYLGTEI